VSASAKNRERRGVDFGIRVGAVVERDGSLLLVRHAKPGVEPYWVLPGGRLEPGETIPECAAREVREETGLSGTFAGVLYVSEFLREGRHTVDLTVRVRVPPEEEAVLGTDPEVEPGAEPTLREVRWVSREDLAGTNLLPVWVRDRLVAERDAQSPKTAGGVYLEGEVAG
jgi:8-oxo-dGTP diphosphatase